MRTPTILLLAALFSILSPQSKAQDETSSGDKSNLPEMLASILHSGAAKDRPSLHISSVIVLTDLVFNDPIGSEILITHGDRLSEEMIDYYFYLYEKNSKDVTLAKSVEKIISILNREMTKGIKPQSIYHGERKSYFEAVKQALNIPELGVNNEGAIKLKLALAYTRIIFETDKPSMVTKTGDIRLLASMSQVAEGWGLKSASKAMLMAAAMASDKFSYIDESPKPPKKKSASSK